MVSRRASRTVTRDGPCVLAIALPATAPTVALALANLSRPHKCVLVLSLLAKLAATDVDYEVVTEA